MGLFKNVAGQRWIVFAFEDGGGTTPSAPVTGDAANITAKIAKDGAAASATNDVNPTELEDGYYQFDLTQAETNADELWLTPESSTANVQVIGVPGVIYTRPANFGDLGIEADGHVHADLKEWLGTAVTTSAGTAKPEVDAFSISDIQATADRLEAWLNGAVTGAATGTPTATAMDTDLTEASDDHFNHMVVVMTGGNLLGQARRITDYDGTNKTLTVQPPFTEAPSATDTFIVVPLIVGGLDANGRTDVGSWLGTAVTLSAGVPDVNIASTDDIDLSATQKASVNAEADTALTDYDPPTRAELTSDINSLNDPTTAEIRDAILDRVLSGNHDTADTPGSFLQNLDAAISSLNDPTAAEIVNAVWDELTSEGRTAGSFGQLIIDNINATIGSRLADSAKPTNWGSMGIEADGHVHGDLKEWLGVAPVALASQLVQADMIALSGDQTAADNLEAMMDGAVVAQVNDASATTTAFAADGFTEATDDHFNGRLITFISGALSGQQTDITDYDAAGHAQGAQTFVVTALTEAPADGDFFIVH